MDEQQTPRLADWARSISFLLILAAILFQSCLYALRGLDMQAWREVALALALIVSPEGAMFAVRALMDRARGAEAVK